MYIFIKQKTKGSKVTRKPSDVSGQPPSNQPTHSPHAPTHRLIACDIITTTVLFASSRLVSGSSCQDSAHLNTWYVHLASAGIDQGRCRAF